MLCGKKLVQAAAPSDPAIVAAIRASPFEPDTRSLRNTYAITEALSQGCGDLAGVAQTPYRSI